MGLHGLVQRGPHRETAMVTQTQVIDQSHCFEISVVDRPFIGPLVFLPHPRIMRHGPTVGLWIDQAALLEYAQHHLHAL